MTDKITRAELLANKLMNRTITPEEEIELNNWYSQNLDKEIEIPGGFVYSEEEHRSRILLSIRNHTHSKKQIRLWPRIVAAAAIAAAVFGAGVWYFGNKPELNNSGQFVSDIGPGKNGATLTLANGQKILINDALTGNIASESGVKISKTADGQIIYEVLEGGSNALAYNTLTTTRGEQTSVRLPDGTLVFLNAESSLRYPNSFAKMEKRSVSLTGEGFFEVAKDKAHPFIVDAEGQVVEVLGTHFNINAYKNSNSVKTTLLEGSVRVSELSGKLSKTLKPGQQAKLADNCIDVNEVVVEDAVAWKNGDFSYDGETLENIMKDVARWYNVEVVFQDEEIKRKEFFISVSRFDRISKLIKLMEKSKTIAFEVKGNRIFISKNKKMD